jgi:DNA-binding MarR family transcriptional regulator
LSSGDLEKREELLAELVREVRQFNGLGASFFRAAASRIGMNVTDLQVTDILDITGPTTAGQLAELTGLTTGAITGMLDRLEKAGLVSRERDPKDAQREMEPIFESIEQGWDEIAAQYDNEQLALILEFLKRSNAMTRAEFARLREAPSNEGNDVSVPFEDAGESQQLLFVGAVRLNLRAEVEMAHLCHAHFTGTVPKVKREGDAITIRYPQRLWMMGVGQRSADVALNPAVPWRITIQGGASYVTAELGALHLLGLEVAGGMSMVRLTLPTPAGTVPVRLTGGASDVRVRRPEGVPVRIHLKGWATHLRLDDQSFDAMGKDVHIQSLGYNEAAPHYEMEITGGASNVVITTNGASE